MFTMWLWQRRGITVIERWAQIAKKTPNNKAFLMGNRSLTFREGDGISNRVAWYFKWQGKLFNYVSESVKSLINQSNTKAAQYIGEICRFLLTVPPGPSDRTHNVRIMIGNGLRPQIWQEFVNRFRIKRVLDFYGATESNTILVNLDSKVGAIGFLNRLISSLRPINLVKCDEVTGEILRDEQGKCIQCGINEPGLLLGKININKEIWTFAGYADKTASERKIVRNVKMNGDCYFNTGDILVMDHYGYFYFKDRSGDTFRWRGENVSTSEVEGVISNLIGLKDVIVYGVTIPNEEGRAGMAAIADSEKKLDLVPLAKKFSYLSTCIR